MEKKEDGFWDSVNEVLKSWPNNRTSDEIVFVKAGDSGTSSHSASGQLTQDKRVASRASSSRSMFNQARKPVAGNQQKHLGHAPQLKQLVAQAQAAALKPKK